MFTRGASAPRFFSKATFYFKMAKTLFEKIWEKHVVKQIEGGPAVLYIDKHFIHEVTSPQAFKGLEKRGLKVLRPQQVVATADHNVPTLQNICLLKMNSPACRFNN